MENEENRLDKVLQKVAKNGVKVYVILFREIQGTLYTLSGYVKKFLENLHENITVIRHPRYYVHLWSHHEKMIIIDSKIVFMGGLDLCFGRYEK